MGNATIPCPLPLMIKCNLGKIWKTHPRRCCKYTFPHFFTLSFFALNIKWIKLKYISQINVGLIMFFLKFGNKIFKIWLTWSWTVWKESIQKRNIINKVQCSNNLVFSVKITFILFKCDRSSIDNSNDFYLFTLWKGSW